MNRILIAVALSAFLGFALDVSAQKKPVERVPTVLKYEKPVADTATVTATGRVIKPGAKLQRTQWVIIYSGIDDPKLRERLTKNELSGLTGHVQDVANQIQGMTSELKELARKTSADVFGEEVDVRGGVEYYDDAGATKRGQEAERAGFIFKQEKPVGDGKIVARLYARRQFAPEDVLGEASCKVVVRCDPTIDAEGEITLRMNISVEEAIPKEGQKIDAAALAAFQKKVETELKKLENAANARVYSLDEDDKTILRKDKVLRRPKTTTYRGDLFVVERIVVPITVKAEVALQINKTMTDWDN